MSVNFYNFPIGNLGIVSDKGNRFRPQDELYLYQVIFKPLWQGIHQIEETPLILEAKNQLDAYFAGNLKEFDLELDYNLKPTFTSYVLDEIQKIPYGETRSYKDIAIAVNEGIMGDDHTSGNYYRAVAQACKNNPLPIIIPCHRVIASNGSLSGYAYGVDKKKYLLELEGAI